MSKNTKTFYSNAETDLILIAVPEGWRSRFIRDAINALNLDAWVKQQLTKIREKT